MTFVIVSVVCVAAFVWLWTRIEPLISRLLDQRDRALTIQEEANKKPVIKPVDPMPQDLVMFVNQEAFGWAREEASKKMWELYAEVGDWQKVRQRWHSEQ